MRFNSESTSNDVIERTFTVDEVPGVLWSPAPADSPSTLLLLGHPGGLNKLAQGLVARARYYVTTLGVRVAAIDAPGHGDRPRSVEDARWVDEMQRARAAGEPLGPIISEFNASISERAVPEWIATLDALQSLPEIADGPVGYSGMTLATEIGVRLIATDPRIGAAALGGAFASDSLIEVARRITVPVQYLLAWDDPEIDRESTFILYDALGSTEKSLHANPGPHSRVPWFETEDSARFFARHLLVPKS
jgi:dienelactone hydrolase